MQRSVVRNLRERIRVHRGKPPLRAIQELRTLLVDAPGGDSTMRAGVQLAASALAASVADWHSPRHPRPQGDRDRRHPWFAVAARRGPPAHGPRAL
jgi:hypothetical protein